MIDTSKEQLYTIGVLLAMFGYGIRSKFGRHELIEDICLTAGLFVPIVYFKGEIHSFLKYLYSLPFVTIRGIEMAIFPFLLFILSVVLLISVKFYWDSKFKKDKELGWYVHSITGKTICSKCWENSRFPTLKSFLCKDNSKVSVSCPRCKTIYMLPFEMLSKEDFMDNSDVSTTNRRPRKKAMRVSTLTKRRI